MTERVKIADPGGATMNFVKVDDNYHVSPFPMPNVADAFITIPNWKMRDDDVMLLAYPKSGTNWLWEMMSMMVARNDEYKPNKVFAEMEALTEELFDNLPSPRVLNTRILPKYLPKEFFEKRIKTVLVLRNPKDVAVSHYNHIHKIIPYEYDGDFKNFLMNFINGQVEYGGIFDFIDVWQKYIKDNPDHPFLIAYYEDLHADCPKELQTINQFLHLDLESEKIQIISSACKFNSLKDGKAKTEADFLKQLWKGKETVYTERVKLVIGKTGLQLPKMKISTEISAKDYIAQFLNLGMNKSSSDWSF